MSITPTQQRRSRSAGTRSASRTVLRFAPVAAIAVTVAVTGCQQTVTSSTAPSASTSTPTTGTAPSSPTPTRTSSTQTSSTTTSTTTTTPTPSSPRVRYLTTWQSPTGNIVCRAERFGYSSQLACQIGAKSYPRPANAAECGGAGAGDNAVRLVSGRPASWACVSDYWGGPNVPVLKYGEVVRVGQLMCESTVPRMTCWELGSYTGFRLSRTHAEVR